MFPLGNTLPWIDWSVLKKKRRFAQWKRASTAVVIVLRREGKLFKTLSKDGRFSPVQLKWVESCAIPPVMWRPSGGCASGQIVLFRCWENRLELAGNLFLPVLLCGKNRKCLQRRVTGGRNHKVSSRFFISSPQSLFHSLRLLTKH